jgi:hypothetical protein
MTSASKLEQTHQLSARTVQQVRGWTNMEDSDAEDTRDGAESNGHCDSSIELMPPITGGTNSVGPALLRIS